MLENNYFNLDMRSLRTFLLIMEKGSITASADQLNITQSAVSHGLEKLRDIFHDPLFVRSGRGITPTPRAIELEKELRPLLKQFEGLLAPREFNPAEASLKWSVSANDFQRDLLLPHFYRLVAPQVVDFSLHISPSEIPTVESLREGDVDLVISPLPPDAPDILQKRLFNTSNDCFYDASVRDAPTTMNDFKQAQYVSLTFMQGKSVSKSTHPLSNAIENNVKVRVPNFSGLVEFLQGSQFLAIAPTLMSKCQLKGFASVPFPYPAKPMMMYMLWHKRNHLDAQHKWLREQLVASCASML